MSMEAVTIFCPTVPCWAASTHVGFNQFSAITEASLAVIRHTDVFLFVSEIVKT